MPTRRCCMPPDKSLQRVGVHAVLGRGRPLNLVVRRHGHGSPGFLSSPSHLALVAEVTGALVGWGTAEIRLCLAWDPRVEITGLVVDTAVRRSGVGRLLVAHIEHWAVDKHCHELFLRSNVARTESHPFYERLGYERTKTQHAYKKVLHAA